jgi:hypothetical protein
MPNHQTASLAIILLPGLALALACSDGTVDLGGGTIARDLSKPTRCTESTSITGDVTVTNQNELDALEGCEEISGSLLVQGFAGANLSPLGSLRTVGDAINLGVQLDDLPEDLDEQVAAQEAYQAVLDAGWLDSFHGLESVESVGRLLLNYTSVEDLSELESLRDITGGLVATGTGLRDLGGLENTNLSFVWITAGNALESLEGLNAPAAMDTVILEQLPALRNVDALDGVTRFNGLFMLWETGLPALPAFREAWGAQDVDIENNDALVDASGLASLTDATSLTVMHNASLASLPSMPQLSSIEQVLIVGNDSLEELSLDFPFEPRTLYLFTRELQLTPALIEIGQNASLRQITSPATLAKIQLFTVYENPNLTDLDLGGLKNADSLVIDSNASLSNVTAASLATVDELQVTNNAALVPSAFENVLTFAKLISGNASAP